MPKAKTKAVSDISQPPESYELALAELEELAVAMESGQLPLTDMMNGYRRASFLLEFCRQQLDTVEAQIRALDEGQIKQWSQD
ncbi:MAG: exodeoxyribonuclease VII small subunit [Comamonas sp.]|jgi:exodeoxyribonuclease VII small subunit|uniref:Exodeoxyribonuclease 7 small subunit n=1 Tax=Comamonas avium TaxID=2762231 RepID=A0ABR8SAI4_9BURK|nr:MULTISPECIES: exodeoxyribonuclease VII small subunit [Comamonas]MBD7960488.1 exodeoxyribonuclease VII small subunit [Comamonas avium]MBD9401746.1 exodeoxyribonuclease VII small subunit [Comamonas sp. CMM02]MBP7648131.1 exodeoxyribonuclease VII small subunit [Comamonas sp.]MBP8187285.1 exodeoxyribonuclease VII small subunit [Comamonas sp.]MBP9940662.1 exodeoxyribonuclease VII small subunit [Comamonas sp.]